MSERLTGNADAKITHVGEVGQAQPTGYLLLAEDHVLLGAVERLPHAYAPLQCPAHLAIEIGMPTDHLVRFFNNRRIAACLASMSPTARRGCT
jgi:hypothetical protein